MLPATGNSALPYEAAKVDIAENFGQMSILSVRVFDGALSLKSVLKAFTEFLDNVSIFP